MTKPFAGLEFRIEPPDTGPVIAAQQAAGAAGAALEAAITALAALDEPDLHNNEHL